MGNFKNQRILIFDWELPHVDEICQLLRKCDSNFVLSVIHDASFSSVKPENYDAVLVCIGILEGYEEEVLKFAKFNSSNKILKAIIIFDKVSPLSTNGLNELYKKKGFDGVLNTPFTYDDLKSTLE